MTRFEGRGTIEPEPSPRAGSCHGLEAFEADIFHRHFLPIKPLQFLNSFARRRLRLLLHPIRFAPSLMGMEQLGQRRGPELIRRPA